MACLRILLLRRLAALKKEKQAVQGSLEAERQAAATALAEKAVRERSLVEEVAKAKATVEDYR